MPRQGREHHPVSFPSSDRAETDFLNSLVQYTGCGLLVDVNNIYANALNEQLAGRCDDPLEACLEWINNIAPDSVGELHLAGHINIGDAVIDELFLRNVARIEWALHCAATAPDAVLDAVSFALLSRADDVQPVSLLPSPGTLAQASIYPVVTIINAHLPGGPALDEAAELLRLGHGEHALVWRQGFKPRVRTLSLAEYQLVTALAKGLSLEAALDQATAVEPAFDFNAWLGAAVQNGLITAAAQVASSK